MWYKRIWSSKWCKDEELESKIVFRGTKLGEGQLGCAEGPMLGRRNILWIQLEEPWSCMVFILAKYQIFLESYVKMVIWTRSGFHSKIKVQVTSSRKRCAQSKEAKIGCNPQFEFDRSTAWDTNEKLKELKCNLSLILSIGMLYYQKGCITMVFGLVSVLK